MKNRNCNKCKKFLSLDNFTNNKNGKFGKRSQCKECDKKYHKAYSMKNKSILSKKAKNYYIKNKNKIIKNQKHYLIKNKSIIRKNNINVVHKYILNDIKQRCNNKNHTHYKYYGGRGIKCLITADEIKQLIIRDKYNTLKRPSIDRIDNDGNYCLENCRFIELGENTARRNKAVCVKKVYKYNLKGKLLKIYLSVKELKQFVDMPYTTLCKKIKRNKCKINNFIFSYSKLNKKYLLNFGD